MNRPEILQTRTAGDSSRSVWADSRGAVTVEYAVILFAVALAGVAALVALGPELVRTLVLRETWLLLPFP